MYQDPPTVSAVYDKKYVADRYDTYDTTPVMSALRLGMLKGYIGAGRLLDVGYGNGSFVKLAMKGGFDAYGCDVHHADYGVREAGIDSEVSWDVVTFFDSLEHFPDLAVIKDLNSRTNMIMISFPCRPDNFPDNRDWRHYRPGEHLHYFTLTSLTHLFSGKQLLVSTNVEDTIRGRPQGRQNIATAIFAKR